MRRASAVTARSSSSPKDAKSWSPQRLARARAPAPELLQLLAGRRSTSGGCRGLGAALRPSRSSASGGMTGGFLVTGAPPPQNVSKSASNSGTSSTRFTSAVRRPSRTSSRSRRSTESSARVASSVSPGPSGSPFGAEATAEARGVLDQIRGDGAHASRRGERGQLSGVEAGAHRPEILLVLEEAAQRLADQLLVEVRGVQRNQRLRPVERLGDAGHLGQLHPAERSG